MSMTTVEQSDLHRILEAYTAALEATDADRLRESWKLPAFLMSDLGARAILNEAEFEDIYGWSMDWYHMQGISKAVPLIEDHRVLTEAMSEVTVRWIGSSAEGNEIWEERTVYLLGRDPQGQTKIRAAINLGGRRRG